jgi:hypothetical protein
MYHTAQIAGMDACNVPPEDAFRKKIPAKKLCLQRTVTRRKIGSRTSQRRMVQTWLDQQVPPLTGTPSTK